MATLLKDLMGTKTAVHCPTPLAWDIVTKVLGYDWKASSWYYFKDQSVISLKMCAIGTLESYTTKGFEIIPAEQFLNNYAGPTLLDEFYSFIDEVNDLLLDVAPTPGIKSNTCTEPLLQPDGEPVTETQQAPTTASELIFTHNNARIVAGVLKRLHSAYEKEGFTFVAGPGYHKPDLNITAIATPAIMNKQNLKRLCTSVGFYHACATLSTQPE